MIFFSQGTYLHFFRGHFDDRTGRGHKKDKSRQIKYFSIKLQFKEQTLSEVTISGIFVGPIFHI